MGAAVGRLHRYMRWLHTGWPAGQVEPLPEVRPDGSTAVPGLYVAGDLTGIPLLKFALDGGARVVQTLAADPEFQRCQGQEGIVDLAIVGGGVAGIAAAVEAAEQGIQARVFEANAPFSTVIDFPRGKPIFTYPTDWRPAGGLQVSAGVKEELVAELEAQRTARGIEPENLRVDSIRREGGLLVLVPGDTGASEVRALRVLVAIGRSGNFRSLGVPGEDRDKVANRLHDPRDYGGREVLVVGGGDSAVEAAIALRACGARVLLSYRKERLTRPKPENLARLDAALASPEERVWLPEPSSERITTAVTQEMLPVEPPGSLEVALGSTVQAIAEAHVTLQLLDGSTVERSNDAVFVMIGREAPLGFFRRSGVPIRGQWTRKTLSSCLAFLVFCVVLYNWKAGGQLKSVFQEQGWFPFGLPDALAAFGGAWARPSHLLGTLRLSLGEPGFFYSLAYTGLVLVFGAARIRRRKTPYVRLQTGSLMAIQVVPLFLLPYLLLPWMGQNGFFEAGLGRSFADSFFPLVDYDPHGREYWRAFGFILAWPLFIWNAFTEEPMGAWLAVGFIQTFVLIPALVWRFGKGAYCGWICSCGALAETLGDTHRSKMPHGARWNRLNGVGQAILAVALLLLILRILSWLAPGLPGISSAKSLYYGLLSGFSVLGIQLNYYWIVDVGLAGILGVGMYFWASGRVWCRFACPLAALMHIYARFSRFRIFAEKSKCISCNQCTSVCHQGIDVMNFANKGLPMEDPQCVRCSACVQSCPTGVLSFGRLGTDRLPILDQLPASSVRVRES